MKLSLIQSSIEWLSPARNRAAAERWIAASVGSSLVVLPEMFATGFCVDAVCCADGGGQTLDWMRLMALRYGVVLAGSVAVEERGRFYNRLYVVRPEGAVESYDKRHLFSFAGEQRSYEAGERRVVVDVDGVRVLLLICYDLRFPVWCRNVGDYDVAICVACWPDSRREVWDMLLRARAIENVAYVCGVNIVGQDPSASYSGGTAVIDYRGRVVAAVEDGLEGVATMEVDMEALERFRAKFPALDDADRFEIKT